jgi:putative addiction module component (TIGR02574 family)
MESADTFALTQAEREELDRRIKEYEEYPSEGVSWDELKKRLIDSRYKGI